MGVLGIFMSRSDAPGANVSTSSAKFDAEVSDFAWWTKDTTGLNNVYPFVHAEASGDITWYHMMKIIDSQGSNEDGFLDRYYDAAGKEVARIEVLNGEFAIMGLGTTNVTSNYIAPPTTKTRWDIKIDLSGSSLVVSLYVDGGASPTLEVTVPTSNTGNPTQIHIISKDAEDCYTSELYVADYDTRNTRPVKQVPNATGNHSAWQGGFADLGDEKVGTGVVGNTAVDKLTMNLEAYPGPSSPAGIKEVVVKMVGAKGATGPSNIRPMVRISSTDYFEANLNPTQEVPLAMYATWTQNPNTAAPWSVADLDTTEFGVEAVT